MSELIGYMKLNEAFQYVSDEFLDIVEQEKRKKRRPVWRIAGTVAACICLLIVLPVSAIAYNWFGLRDLILPKEDNEITCLTMTDYSGRPEVIARREWEHFLEGYDLDGTQYSKAIEDGFSTEGREDWDLYGVYTYDMGEMLDRIAKEYGLTLHTHMDYISGEELENRVGGSFMEDVSVENCRVYEDGSLHFVGVTKLDGSGMVFFRLTCAVKGALDENIPYMGHDDGYAEWQYDTVYGESVRLALGTYEARVLKESDDRYIIVDMPYGKVYGITNENLQELVDKIDFRMLTDMQLPERSDSRPLPSISPISLSGYMDSPESQALAEWEDFLAHYDADHKVLDQLGNGVFIAEGREDWSQYSVYSYEMGEKLDEIVEKYGLKLHTDVNVIDQDELMYRVGGSFMDKESLTWAYMYEDGFFHVEGDVELAGCGTTDFQFIRSVKGTFNGVALYVRQVEDYTDWQYITACGEPALIAMGPYHALIFADFDDCFVTVNVLLGSEDGMTQEDLQTLADKIDFRILKDVKTPDMRGDSEVPRE